MKTVTSKILLSMLLFATYEANAMGFSSQSDVDKVKEPIITLGSIDNKMTYPEPGGHIECLIGGKEIGLIPSGNAKALNTVLLTHNDKLPLIKRLNLELHHPMQKSFKEFRLKLEILKDFSEVKPLHLKIVKDLSDGTQRPQEVHPIDDRKKYLLNLTIQRGDDDKDEVVANLVEDNSATTTE